MKKFLFGWVALSVIGLGLTIYGYIYNQGLFVIGFTLFIWSSYFTVDFILFMKRMEK